MSEEKIPILAVVGATASGKTRLGAELAAAYHGEVVSADSMQLYEGLPIISAKPTEEEMQGVPHHLIGCIPRTQSFSLADYLQLAAETIRQIRGRAHLPVLVGGTGLYIESLLSNVQLCDAPGDPAVRAALEQLDSHILHERLRSTDPDAAEWIHPHNRVRLIRALEIAVSTGKTYTQWRAESHRLPSPYNACIIGLHYPDRETLYARINARVDAMLQNGMVEEAYAVYQQSGQTTAAAAIGYKELIPYFNGQAELTDCIEHIKQVTRHYAKRQLTWFRRMPNINWVTVEKDDDFFEIQKKSKKIIAKSKIL